MTCVNLSDRKSFPPRRLMQFSIRSTLAFILVCGLFFAWLSLNINLYRLERQSVRKVTKAGGSVIFAANGSTWLNIVTGGTTSQRVVTVHLSDCQPKGSIPGGRGSTYLWETEYGRPFTVADFAGLTDIDGFFIKEVGAGLRGNTSGGDITDGFLANLRHLTQAKLVDLRNTNITDAGLIHLGCLTKLEWLYLTGTNVTQIGIRGLQQTLPQCHIVY